MIRIVNRIIAGTECSYNDIIGLVVAWNFIFQHATGKVFFRSEHSAVLSNDLDSAKPAISRRIDLDSQLVVHR